MNLEQIDTSTTAGKAEVMRLAAEGRRVATRQPHNLESLWTETQLPVWDWWGMTYAIISEPVGPEEVWVSVAESGSVGSVSTSPFTTWPNQKLVRYLRADLAGEKGEETQEEPLDRYGRFVTREVR